MKDTYLQHARRQVFSGCAREHEPPPAPPPDAAGTAWRGGVHAPSRARAAAHMLQTARHVVRVLRVEGRRGRARGTEGPPSSSLKREESLGIFLHSLFIAAREGRRGFEEGGISRGDDAQKAERGAEGSATPGGWDPPRREIAAFRSRSRSIDPPGSAPRPPRRPALSPRGAGARGPVHGARAELVPRRRAAAA